MDRDKDIMEALLRGEEVCDGPVRLRLGEDGFLESYAGEPDGKWMKRTDILASYNYAYKKGRYVKREAVRLTLKREK